MPISRIEQQLDFINEIEELKTVYRRNRTKDRSRFENSAEHSWHVALMALVLAEHANEPKLDLLKVVKLLLIHDLVEIYAGDTWLYDEAGREQQEDREKKAAQKLFSLLPSDQAQEFNTLWLEFEARHSPEAKYAASIDLLQPLSNNLLSGSAEDDAPKPSAAAVFQRKSAIAEGSLPLWEVAQELIHQSVENGLYLSDKQ